MRVALDATPLLGPRTGVGQYVDNLVRSLAGRGDGPEIVLTPFTLRGGEMPSDVPAGVRWRHLPVPARLLQRAWSRSPHPSVEWFSGPVDVFHATNFVSPPTRRARSVVTIHDLGFETSPESVTAEVARYRELVPRGLQRASVVLTPSEGVAQEVHDVYGVATDRLVVSPLGVSPSWSQAVPLTREQLTELGLPDRYLLFVGARQPRKDLPTLLAAHAAARATHPDVPDLLLVGPTGWGTPVEPGPGVVIRDHLPRDLLQRLVSTADAVVMASRYEGFGLPVLEAMASGTAVLASDISAHREVGGAVPRFFPVGDAEALAHLIVTAVPDQERVALGRARAATFTWEACAEATLTAYRRAMS